MREQLISLDDIIKLHPIFKKSYGRALAGFVFKLAGLSRANAAYDSTKHLTGPDIENKMIEGLGIYKKVHNIQVLDALNNQAFITVSNHPYGHIDGIMLLGTLLEKRSDFKILVNWMLSNIDTMEDHFIGVNPYQSGTVSDKSSLGGVKESIRHIKENHPLGFFPAGAISKNKITKIEDRDWQPTVLKLIQKVKVPVVPVYISGTNSAFFNVLDVIDWRLRTLRLCYELTNKKGKTIHLVFGKPISVQEQAQFKTVEELGSYLKAQTYLLKNQI